MIAESKLQNEITSCPTCNTTISKDLCSRNIAVENTICQLPVTCPYCCLEYPLDAYKYHKTLECMERPSLCENYSIGCLWKGPFKEKHHHEAQCRQPHLNGYNILKCLETVDKQRTEEVKFYDKILELLSVEKNAYSDIQFKPCGEDNKNLLFETSKFSAFGLQWLVRACCLKDMTESLPLQLKYQLVAKSRLNSEMNLHFIILRGPYIEMEIKPNLYEFKFCEKAVESEYQVLTLLNQTDLAKFQTAKRISLRIIMFLER
ncbi:zinc finger TRAF-type-containing protein 1 homolog [Uloborus diversus]|uniref:zinc finger TRAF-type-containing protein 1 homolog n=1 Tax=Uloborus diversus TaxID=327109 RepID=UPI0024090B83|nr:zinc finger TRAF-type-containing protein 1 homolog [Uloborus diversus]